MSLWEYALLFGGVMAGGLAGFAFPVRTRQTLQTVLSFSGAYIVGIIFLHIAPMVFSEGTSHIVGLWVLGGFIGQLFLEQLSAGIEHGHIHAPRQLSTGFVLSVLAGLSIHAYVEGMPLQYYDDLLMHGHDTTAGASGHTHYFAGILLHHMPAAFALVSLLRLAGLRKWSVLICLAVFASMSPLGAISAGWISLSVSLQKGILGLAMGSLLHIATVILFEMDSSSHMHLSARRMLAILAGIGASMLTMF
ncbi:MAG: hypothetical protein KatS3mg029_0524 [Saprospiraceae bacterium]|nr:MAG: hypothetical protein KatS3mg029_0521 [Saprospiraceae bacterium]GIV31173.1 MAG: hypothetical protein KatS3mg029_0524 [Saprospiraceae bacterium]